MNQSEYNYIQSRNREEGIETEKDEHGYIVDVQNKGVSPQVPLWEKKLPNQLPQRRIVNYQVPKMKTLSMPNNDGIRRVFTMSKGAHEKLFKFKDQAESRIRKQRGLSPWGDYDGDGVINMLDCDPRDPKKQGSGHEDEPDLIQQEKERRGVESFEEPQKLTLLQKLGLKKTDQEKEAEMQAKITGQKRAQKKYAKVQAQQYEKQAYQYYSSRPSDAIRTPGQAVGIIASAGQRASELLSTRQSGGASGLQQRLKSDSGLNANRSATIGNKINLYNVLNMGEVLSTPKRTSSKLTSKSKTKPKTASKKKSAPKRQAKPKKQSYKQKINKLNKAFKRFK